MNTKVIASIVIIIILVALGIFFFLPKEDSMPNENGAENGLPVYTDIIDAKHQFVDGKHIVAGEINLPTPCHILEAEAIVRESFPEQVLIDIKVSTQAEACAQVITPARFKVEFEASEDAVITAAVNDEPVVLNLVEVGPEEDLEDFELFIKG